MPTSSARWLNMAVYNCLLTDKVIDFNGGITNLLQNRTRFPALRLREGGQRAIAIVKPNCGADGERVTFSGRLILLKQSHLRKMGILGQWFQRMAGLCRNIRFREQVEPFPRCPLR